MPGPRAALSVVAAAVALAAPRTARAWVFEEHANIGRNAVHWLEVATPKPESERLQQLWKVLQEHSRGRLCRDPYRDFAKPRTPDPKDQCVDFGMLTAIAGDHSCSPEEMWDAVIGQSWLLDVTEFAASMSAQLLKAGSMDEHIDIWHQSNLVLLHYDHQYLSRATHNNSHFVLPRAPRTSRLDEYVRSVTATNSPMNATAAYLLFHLGALDAVAHLPGVESGQDAYVNAVIRAVASEAFALHFLEDSFAAGHVAGASGDSSQRMGTHDYYCEHGLSAETWGTSRFYDAFGDSFLGQTDLDAASQAVAVSLREFFDAAADGASPVTGTAQYETLDICLPDTVDAPASSLIRQALDSASGKGAIEDVLNATIMPPSEGAPLPSFKNELGGFFRADAGGEIGAAFGGPGTWDGYPRLQAAALLSLGFGADVSGLTNRATDGQFFLKADLAARSGQEELSCPMGCPAPREGIRFEFGGTVRVPFWLIPGDLLLLSPFIGQPWYTDIAIRAAEGGLIGRAERIHHAALGTWQFILLRQVSVRRTDNFNDYFPCSRGNSCGGAGWLLQFPLMELSTPRVYSGDLGGGVTLFQPGVEIDTNPGGTSIVGYVKVSLEGRYYVVRP